MVTEVLLQKTSSYKVSRVFQPFFESFPSVEALAHANEADIELVVKPLGLQRVRSVLLKKLGTQLLNDFSGVVPRTRQELLSFVGVGEYTANAVLCFAFDATLPLLDVNFTRVLGRVFWGSADAGRLRDAEWWSDFTKVVPKGSYKELNWALLDFSSLVCSGRKPKCLRCNLRGLCKYQAQFD